MNFTIDLFFAKQDLSLYLAVSNQTTGRESERQILKKGKKFIQIWLT
jgi:hypothetical protein